MGISPVEFLVLPRMLALIVIMPLLTMYANLLGIIGGGIVAEPQTYGTLLERFHTVWVRTSPAEHMARVRAQGDLRPMKDNPAAMDQLKALLTARTPQYERAQAQVDTANRPVQSSVNDLLAVIAKHRFVESISV